MRTHPSAGDELQHDAATQHTSSRVGGSVDGLFPAGSMIREVGQEALGLLGGGRAVLLQLAHPLVAAGVAEYSEFQRDPLHRLLNTLELMHTLVFGSRRQAQAALKRFQAVHARIRGRLPRAVGRFPAGTVYGGNDPKLKWWVAATLIDTSLIAYPHFVAPLAEEDQRRYYQDALVLARLMQIPEEILPPSLGAFRAYMGEMVAGDTLAVDERARRLAWDVLQPGDVGVVPAGCARLLRFVAAGLLPPRLRRAYGLAWNARKQWLLERFGATTRRLRPVVPVWVWQSPQLQGTLARLLLWGATSFR